MQPEDAEEERSEGVKHLGEEVPPEARVRGEVRQGERRKVQGVDESEGGEQEAGEGE